MSQATAAEPILICLKPIPRKSASNMIRRKIALRPGGPTITLFQKNRVGEERDPDKENFVEIDDRRIVRRLLSKEEYEIALVDDDYLPEEAHVEGREVVTNSKGEEVDATADVVAHAELEAQVRKGERAAKRREQRGGPAIEETLAPKATRKKKTKTKRKRKPRSRS